MSGQPEHQLGSRIEHWDYAADLRFTRALALDVQIASQQLQIDAEELSVMAVVTTGTGGFKGDKRREIVWSCQLTQGRERCEIELELRGFELSQAVSLTTELLLIAGAVPKSRLSPARTGLRLWKDSKVLHLEPESARFPIEAVSFKALFPDRGFSSFFHVDCSPSDLDREFSSAVRLYLNADQSEFLDRFAAGDKTLLRLVMGSVMNHLVRLVLDDAFAPEGAELGSLRATLAGWLEQAFPGQSVNTVRSMAKYDPAAFEAALSSIAAEQWAQND
jgi:hypothetical protein